MSKKIINKNDVVNKIADTVELTKKNIETVINELGNVIRSETVEGNAVRISGLGTFEKKVKKGREGIIQMGTNKGNPYKTEDSFDVKFSCAKAFKEMVNGE